MPNNDDVVTGNENTLPKQDELPGTGFEPILVTAGAAASVVDGPNVLELFVVPKLKQLDTFDAVVELPNPVCFTLLCKLVCNSWGIGGAGGTLFVGIDFVPNKALGTRDGGGWDVVSWTLPNGDVVDVFTNKPELASNEADLVLPNNVLHQIDHFEVVVAVQALYTGYR